MPGIAIGISIAWPAAAGLPANVILFNGVPVLFDGLEILFTGI